MSIIPAGSGLAPLTLESSDSLLPPLCSHLRGTRLFCISEGSESPRACGIGYIQIGLADELNRRDGELNQKRWKVCGDVFVRRAGNLLGVFVVG